ncbi:MAG: amidohydrolase [Treponema sp.]|jgi:predicted TIM-barrel fold metal-dependent hydrolase|nr:amidohydrolase [Treponema sp.]
MLKIDAHVHVIETIAGFGGRGELRGCGGGKARWADGEEISLIPPDLGDRGFSYEALVSLLDKNGVEKAILLQGSMYGFQNDYTWEAARRYPGRLIPSATVDPFCANAEALLERYLGERKIPVVKFEVSSGGGLMGYHRVFPLDGPPIAALYPAINKAGAALVLDIGSPGMGSFQIEAVAAAAKRYPQMRIIVCHLLAPRPADEEVFTAALKALAFPNLWFDLAALPWNAAGPDAYPYPTSLCFIGLAKKILGAGKLLWGSDVPITLTRETYARQMSYLEESGVFSDAELEKVFRTNAETAYALDKRTG